MICRLSSLGGGRIVCDNENSPTVEYPRRAGGSSLLNRIAPAVLAVCLSAAVPVRSAPAASVDTAVSKPDKTLNTVHQKTMRLDDRCGEGRGRGRRAGRPRAGADRNVLRCGVGRHRGAANAHADRLLAAVCRATPLGVRSFDRRPALQGIGRARQEYR